MPRRFYRASVNSVLYKERENNNKVVRVSDVGDHDTGSCNDFLMLRHVREIVCAITVTMLFDVGHC